VYVYTCSCVPRPLWFTKMHNPPSVPPNQTLSIFDLLCDILNGYSEYTRAEEGGLASHGGKVDEVLQDELYAALRV